MTIHNDRLLRVLRRQPVDRTPVWIMRQAGRYLPEYRQLRTTAQSFLHFCQTPELACRAALQPLARFDLDAAVLFSDILVVADAMGAELQFRDGIGPEINNPLRCEMDVAQLKMPDPNQALRYVTEAIEMTQRELAGRVPLIGFAGSPWTIACYMVEGKSSKNFHQIKQMCYCQPALLHRLLTKLTTTIIEFIQAQVAAGVQAVMLFDTWGGILTTHDFEQFSLDYMAQIVQAIQQTTDIPCILYTKYSTPWLSRIAKTGCDAIGVDWTVNMSDARQQVGETITLQGNMDPLALLGSDERVRNEVARVLASYGHGHGHIFNLGHGITPQILPERVQAMVNAVHELSPKYHRH